MKSVPLIPKPKVLPNLDTCPLIRELFQDELSTTVPTRKFSENIVQTTELEKLGLQEKTFRSVEFFENFTKRRDGLIDFAENVLEAYITHEKDLEEIREVEKDIFEAQACYTTRELMILENRPLQDLLKLKRHPLFKSLNPDYVKKFKLLQGESGLPPKYEAKSDFRVKDFYEWRQRLQRTSTDSLIPNYTNKLMHFCWPKDENTCLQLKKEIVPRQHKTVTHKKASKAKLKIKQVELLRPEPQIVFFTGFKLGDIYVAEIRVKNVCTKVVSFLLRPMNEKSPFHVRLCSSDSTKVFPGLSFVIIAEFTPQSLDNVAEDIVIFTKNKTEIMIPLVAYLEPPILKTHKDIDETRRTPAEKIMSSFIECGGCFTGDTKVIKIRFQCFRGSGEFFIMSSDNWSRSHVNTVTQDNHLELPPYRIYPAFFKLEKDEVIDLFVEFSPKISGTHIENVMVLCNNGEVRSLDIFGDAIGWHSYYFSFQESLTKELNVNLDDDVKVKFLLDFNTMTQTEVLKKTFCVCNHSNMAFEFQWKIREANISGIHDKYLKLNRNQVKIEPENGTFEPNTIWSFHVTITLNKAEIGEYRMVLSMYVLNLPYQCIEEDNTIIQPTGLVRNIYSQSLYGEEDYTLLSPEIASLQGTYESLQESIKSYVECQSKSQSNPKFDYCKTTCAPNPGLCAKPLKKSKTFCNIGETVDDDGVCYCKAKPIEKKPIEIQPETISESGCSGYREVNDSNCVKNEIIWDFVDILIDEVELWLEVVPTRVTIEPHVLCLKDPLKLNDFPQSKIVLITNHNNIPISCTWVKQISNRLDSDSTQTEEFKKLKKCTVCLTNNLFAKPEPPKKYNGVSIGKSGNETIEDDRRKKNPIDILMRFTSQREKCQDNCQIVVDTESSFEVPPMSTHRCKFNIFACKPGKFTETLYLSVNGDDLKLKLLIIGKVQRRLFMAVPHYLNFGAVKKGTRTTKEYKLVNESLAPLKWQLKHYKFDFFEEKFNLVSEENRKKKEGLLRCIGSRAFHEFFLDAKTTGIKYSLLEFSSIEPEPENVQTKYILALANVKVPVMTLSAPRFENAILAPAGSMYVGQKIVTKVYLMNRGTVPTVFIWGNPFGCHCRNLKVEISPNTRKISQKKKMAITFTLIPLGEGIVSHCYVPCFFSRNSEPLILSIVGLIKNLHVTFEILDDPDGKTLQNQKICMPSTNYMTTHRIPWPVPKINVTLGMSYIKEENIMNMKCHCLEVEEEYDKYLFSKDNENENKYQEGISLKTLPRTLDSKSLDRTPVSSQMQSMRDAEYKESHLLDGSGVSSSSSALVLHNQANSSFYKDSFQFMKPEVKFLSVPFRTPAVRRFVIRNETPLETKFNLKVVNFYEKEIDSQNKITIIKNRVLGYTKDEFAHLLDKETPLIIRVEPSEGTLTAFDAICIKITAYGNTWGEYRDIIKCQIAGMETFDMKLLIQVVGHPITFPAFLSPNSNFEKKPTLRFQTLSSISAAETKTIRVYNRSSVPLTISWLIFLTYPPQKPSEEQESYNLRVDSNFIGSSHSGENSTMSSKVYLSKNASEPSRFNMDSDEGNFSASIQSSLKAEKINAKDEIQDFSVPQSLKLSLSDEKNLEYQSCTFLGRMDTSTFIVAPKEMSFGPMEESKITITFDPRLCKPLNAVQMYKGILTGCVRLNPEDSHKSRIYDRPCGLNYVSELMDIDAQVETPLLFCEVTKKDLRYLINANDVINSRYKRAKMSKRFIIKNRNQMPVNIKIKVKPGDLFRVNRISTIDKYYRGYAGCQVINIEPGQALEVEIECHVSYKDVMYAYAQLKLTRRKEKVASAADEAKEQRTSLEKRDEIDFIWDQVEREPWRQLFDSLPANVRDRDGCAITPRDSLPINLQRLSLDTQSRNSVCMDRHGKTENYTEAEGEYFELPWEDDGNHPVKPKCPTHVTPIQEELQLVQAGLICQTLQLVAHITFPMIKILPRYLDFGNVYIGETSVRYVSLINLSKFEMNYKVKTKASMTDFFVSEATGKLQPLNHTLDIGQTITVTFSPSQPGYFKDVFHVYCNEDMEFDSYDINVSGMGSWNEKYRGLKNENYTRLLGMFSKTSISRHKTKRK